MLDDDDMNRLGEFSEDALPSKFCDDVCKEKRLK
jgi:hypothetical protein